MGAEGHHAELAAASSPPRCLRRLPQPQTHQRVEEDTQGPLPLSWSAGRLMDGRRADRYSQCRPSQFSDRRKARERSAGCSRAVHKVANSPQCLNTWRRRPALPQPPSLTTSPQIKKWMRADVLQESHIRDASFRPGRHDEPW